MAYAQTFGSTVQAATNPRRTPCGFDFGAAKVTCMASDEKAGVVYIGLTTPKHKFQFRVTKTGKVRIFTNGFEALS